MFVPKGFVPLLLMSALFLVPPVVDGFASIDYGSDTSKLLAVGYASTLATVVVMANECSAWFNFALFFHIGLETRVLELLATYAQAATTTDTDMALAWTAFVVIIVHLLPFVLMDHAYLLALLAFAGVVINAVVVIYVPVVTLAFSPFLFLVVLSALVLLGATTCIQGVCAAKCSLLTSLRESMRDGSWFACQRYAM